VALLGGLFAEFSSEAEAAAECFACDDNCYRCGVQETDETLSDGSPANLVTIDLSCCKDGARLSWVSCCRDQRCEAPDESSCNPPDNGKWECNEVSSQQFLVAKDAVSISVQVHDGRAGGNLNEGIEPCAGSGNNNCAGYPNSVCDWTINLDDCTEGPPLDIYPYCNGCPDPNEEDCCIPDPPSSCDCSKINCCPEGPQKGCCAQTQNEYCDCNGIICDDGWECEVVCRKHHQNTFCYDEPTIFTRGLKESALAASHKRIRHG
jgi:hypothetical protein